MANEFDGQLDPIEEAQIKEALAAFEADPEMAPMFVAESLDHLSTIEASLLQLEERPGDKTLLNDVFRPFHTLKGNAGALGITTLQEFAHKVESLLDLCRSGKHVLGEAEIDVVLRAVDLATAMINDLATRVAGGSGQPLRANRMALMAAVDALIAGGASAPAPPHAAPAPAGNAWNASIPPVAATVASDSAAPAVPLAAATAERAGTAPPVAAPSAEAAAAAAAEDADFFKPSIPAPLPATAAAVAPSGTPAESGGATPAFNPAGRRAGDAPPDGGPARERETTVKVDTRKLDGLVDTVGELVILQSLIYESPALVHAGDEKLARNLAQLRRITTELQHSAMSMRMVPIRQTFQKMARLVRDLGKLSGKHVELTLTGEDTELDRKVVEDINDPLMHMVRNSIDHGLEPNDARVTLGKPRAGHLSLRAFHQSGNIVIQVGDDGAGLKTERILAKAIERGLVGANEALSPAQIHHLIFAPGFSTAEKVTEISGRGVGMDVVRRNIEALRGRVEIDSVPGQGTTFSIKLPLTLAILDGLVVTVAHERFVIPTFSVRESLRPQPAQVHTVNGAPKMVRVRDRLLPLLWLSEFFGLSTPPIDPLASTIVVIEEDHRRLGLVVDTLVGKQEVVVKPLGETFAGVAGVEGGAILGDGRVGLILDAHGIVKSCGSQLDDAHAQAAA